MLFNIMARFHNLVLPITTAGMDSLEVTDTSYEIWKRERGTFDSILSKYLQSINLICHTVLN